MTRALPRLRALAAGLKKKWGGMPQIQVDDLVSAGSIALLALIEKGDRTNGWRFSAAYPRAAAWAMSKEAWTIHAVRVPDTAREAARNVRRIAEALHDQLGHRPSDEQIREACGSGSTAEVADLLRLAGLGMATERLSQPAARDGSGPSLAALVPNPAARTPLEILSAGTDDEPDSRWSSLTEGLTGEQRKAVDCVHRRGMTRQVAARFIGIATRTLHLRLQAAYAVIRSRVGGANPTERQVA